MLKIILNVSVRIKDRIGGHYKPKGQYYFPHFYEPRIRNSFGDINF